jgi:pimeloyl-ACP methyl ester carboxylesterase
MDAVMAGARNNDAGVARCVSRRGLLRAGAATGLGVALACALGRAASTGAAPITTAGQQASEGSDTMAGPMNVVLVHGAFADASSWSRVIPLLQQAGYRVAAVQNPLTSLADDIATTRRVIDAIQGPVTLVGHSYGGAVISGAGSAPNVASLVYVAAFAPDEGETLGELGMRFPPLPSLQHYRPDAAGFLSVDPETFPQDFAADVDPEQAKMLAVVQRPIAASIFAEKAGTPAWRTRPTFYQVSENDGMISPDLERFFAERMKAKTISLASSHATMVSHPWEIAQLIADAARAPSPA